MSALACAAAYQFRDVDDPTAIADSLRECCTQHAILGTITVAPEGINLGVCGSTTALTALAAHLHAQTPFTDVTWQPSAIESSPYRRLAVDCRDTLLAVHIDTPVAERAVAQHVAPRTLCDWLDAGNTVHLVDVRNRFESRLGKFAQAHTLALERFADFPEQAQTLPTDGPLVLYCTGGIRCEVASAWLAEHAVQPREIYQLSGGILHYFADCGGAHWEGECFVFDDRYAVDSSGQATYPTLCRHCQRPMPPRDDRVCADCAH